MRIGTVYAVLATCIIFTFSACSSAEDERHTPDQQQSPHEVGRQMAEQMKQPTIDAESARKLSSDRLREIEDVSKE